MTVSQENFCVKQNRTGPIMDITLNDFEEISTTEEINWDDYVEEFFGENSIIILE